MPYKRGYRKSAKTVKRYSRKKPAASKLSKPMYKAVRNVVQKQLNRVVETKKAVYSNQDGIEILHNNFVTMDSNPLFTSQGTTDPNISDTQNRIGDKILSKGLYYRCMFELNERYSDVTFRLMLIRSSRGDTPTRATLFCGASGNKMIDYVNTERYTILYQKFFKIKAPAASVASPTEVGGIGSGIVMTTANRDNTLSRATRIINFKVPSYKLGQKGSITYDSGNGTPKTYDYTLVCYAYSNYSTLQDIYNVARLNDFVRCHYFQDA